MWINAVSEWITNALQSIAEKKVAPPTEELFVRHLTAVSTTGESITLAVLASDDDLLDFCKAAVDGASLSFTGNVFTVTGTLQPVEQKKSYAQILNC